MTALPTPAQHEKLFQQRRAGLLERDDHADQAFLSQLRLLQPGPPGTPPHLRPVRELTGDESQRYLEGRPIGSPGDVVRVDILERAQAARTAQDRAASARRAERAASEAARLAREAKRFG